MGDAKCVIAFFSRESRALNACLPGAIQSRSSGKPALALRNRRNRHDLARDILATPLLSHGQQEIGKLMGCAEYFLSDPKRHRAQFFTVPMLVKSVRRSE